MNTIVQASSASQSRSKLDNRRMLAALIDLAVVGAGGAVILVAAGVLGGDGASLGAPLAAVVAGWALYYYFACESSRGQTLGKKAMGLRVVRVDGHEAGMDAVAMRTVLRLVDTALVGLVTMLGTGERRARLGDLAAGTMIVSTDAAAPTMGSATTAAAAAATAGTPASAEPAAQPPAVEDAPAAETPAVPELRPFEPFGEGEPAAEATDEPPAASEPVVEAASEPVEVASEPVVEVTSEPVVEDASEPVVELADDPVSPGPALSVVEPPPVELSVVEAAAVEPVGEEPVAPAPSSAVQPVADEPAAPVEPAAPAEPSGADQDHTLDIASPSLQELARDVAAAKASQPEPAAEPVVEVDVAGPEVDVDEPDMTVRSVETVSAIDVIMGGEEPGDDEQTGGSQPPAIA